LVDALQLVKWIHLQTTGLEILEKSSQGVSLEVVSRPSRIDIRNYLQYQQMNIRGSDHHLLLHGSMTGIKNEKGILLGVMKEEIGNFHVAT
jgi:hypothetical protein